MVLIKDNSCLKLFLAIVAGAILPFAFSPYSLYPLSFLSIATLFYLWSVSTQKEAFLIGYLFGFAYFGIGVNWLHISINLFGGVNFIGALIFTYMLVAFIALYPALCGYLAVRFFKDRLLIILPLLWVLTEWCRGWFLTGFPWLNLGTTQTDSLFASYAPIIGDYGLTLIVCLIATGLVSILTSKTKQKIVSLILISLLAVSAFLIRDINWTKPNGNYMTVALIQGAIPQEIKWKREQREKTYQIYAGLSEPFWSSDLIIWPETAIPSFYNTANDFLDRIKTRKAQSETLFMSGLAYLNQDTDQYYNSILLIDKGDRFYHKHHLVPFGEYLPLKPILGEILQFLQIPMSDFSSGTPDQKLLQTDKAIFGMSICYEDAYADEIRKTMPDANILINVSNDAWFGDSIAPHQHLQIARMRALENGRYLLRSTNTGISAVIDEKGKIVSQSPQFIPHALPATVKLFEGVTPYSFYGNYLIISICSVLLILLFVVRREKH